MANLIRNVMELLGQLVSLGLGTPNRKFKFVNKISHTFHPLFFAKYELPARRIEMSNFSCPHRFVLSVSYEYPRCYCKFSWNNLVSARNRRQCPAEVEVRRIYIVQEKRKSKKLQQDTGDHFPISFSMSFFIFFSPFSPGSTEAGANTRQDFFFTWYCYFIFEVTVYTRVLFLFVFTLSRFSSVYIPFRFLGLHALLSQTPEFPRWSLISHGSSSKIHDRCLSTPSTTGGGGNGKSFERSLPRLNRSYQVVDVRPTGTHSRKSRY